MRQLKPRASPKLSSAHPLFGKKTYLPRMAEGSARALAAVMRSFGVDAEVVAPSDGRTLELGGKYSSGDECFPLKVTLGDFLRIVEQPGFEGAKTAFFMTTGQGPCRFGQYVPYLRSILGKLGHPDVTIFTPTTEKSYHDFGDASRAFTRCAWRAIVSADLLLKLLLKCRPYEVQAGSAERAYGESLGDLSVVLEQSSGDLAGQLEALQECLVRARTRFRALELRADDRMPLIGIVGEIFCRLNEFSNNELVRRIEDAGGEVWMNDISEWIWYTSVDGLYRLKTQGRQFSREALGAHLRSHFQHRDERALLAPFEEDFRGYEEPHDVQVVLDYAEPYLPACGVNGEMVLNVGKAVYFARKGLDGVIDISPFTCMNGIVGEAVYPRVSRDNAGIPIRNFYFDGTHSDLDRDIGIFLELAKSYQRQKPWPRTQPVLGRSASAAG